MKNKRIKSVVALLLTVAMLIGGMTLPLTAAVSEPPRLDYSDPDSPTSPKEIKASEFLALLGGESISSAEASYVDSVLGGVFTYGDRIPTGRVELRYDGSTVYVSAAPYEYTAEDGTAVSWTPNKATLQGRDYTLSYSSSSGKYECAISFSAPAESADYYNVDIEYVFTLTVKAADADKHLNYAYRRALELDGEMRDYDLKLAAYNDYTAYLEAVKRYEQDQKAYDEYLKAKKQYDSAMVRYNNYLAEKKVYDEALAKYLLYKESVDTFPQRMAEYEAYLAAKDKYAADKISYENYLAVIEKAEKKLVLMDNIFLANSKGQVMYNTLWGPTVGQVLENQDDLINYGKVEAAVIERTGDATEKLKDLLKAYSELDGLYEKYDYYVKNYSALKENFVILYQNLRQLYENDAVYAGIVQKERLNRYVEFVSHLYVLQCCFDDKFAMDGGWTIKREYSDSARDYIYYSYKDLLEACQIIEDHNNYAPTDLMTLPERMTEPTEPNVVEPPKVLPTEKEPVAPDEVDEPKRPTEVDEPVMPTEVKPADKPAEKVYTEGERGIVNAYREKKLTERNVKNDIVIALTASCQKLLSTNERYIVTFYDDNGTTVLYRYEAKYLDVVAYGGFTPSKKATAQYTYTFSGWKDAAGGDAVFGEVTDYETVFYASYTAKLNKYKVTWRVDGSDFIERYEYGETPSFKGDTVKAMTERYVYTFSHWDKPIEKVTGNVVYEAVYEVSDRTYAITFVVDGEKHTEQYKFGEMPVFKGSTEKAEDLMYYYIFLGWDKTVTAVSGDATYTAMYEKIPMVEEDDDDDVIPDPPQPLETDPPETDPPEDETQIDPDNPEETAEETPPERTTEDKTDPDPTPEESSADSDADSQPSDTPESAPVEPDESRPEESDNGDKPQAPTESLPGSSEGDQPSEPGESEEETPAETNPQSGTVITPPTEDYNYYSVSVSGSSVKISGLALVASKNNAGIELSWQDYRVILSEKAVLDFIEKDGAQVKLTKGEENDSYVLQILSSKKEPVTLDVPLSVIIKNEFCDEYTEVYIRDAEGVETKQPSAYAGGEVTVKLSSGCTIILKNSYPIDINDFVGGIIVADKSEAHSGETVSLQVKIDGEYILDSIEIVGKISGETYTLDDNGNLLMPSEPVSVTVKTLDRLYTVIFISEGVVISERQYKKGELIEKPADPTKSATERAIYQFLEWDPLFKDGATVVGDVTYTAVFKELLIEDQQDFVPEEDNRFIVFVVTLLCVFLVCLGGMITAIILLMKKRKKKKASKRPRQKKNK